MDVRWPRPGRRSRGERPKRGALVGALVGILALAGMAQSAVPAASAPAYLVAADGFAFIDSEEGDRGGRELQLSFTEADAEFRSYPTGGWDGPGNAAGVYVDNDPQLPPILSVTVSAPAGQPLGVGHYEVVDPYEGPGMYITTLNGYCPNQVGSFDVHDVAFAGDIAARLAVSWEVFCAGGADSTAFRGQIRFDSTVPADGRSIPAVPVDLTGVLVGTSATRTLTVANPMATAMTITSLELSGPDADALEIVSNTCPASLAAGATCSATLRFSPTTRGAADVDLVLRDSVTPGGRRLGIAAVGVAPVLGGRSELTLPPADIGNESLAAFQVANIGDRTLTVTGIDVAGTHADEFIVEAGGCPTSLPIVLDPEESCWMQARFAPQVAGSRTASVMFQSDGGERTMTLSGIGQQAVLTVPDQLEFPDAGIGGATTATLKISNTGDGTLDLVDVVFEDGDARAFSITGGSCYYGDRLVPVVPNSWCTIDFRFAPTSIRPHALAVTVVSEWDDETVRLRGSGVGPPAAPPRWPAPTGTGYWMVGRTGDVYAFGDAGWFGSVVPPAGSEIVDLEPTPSGRGYWTVTGTGAVYAFGDAGWFGGSPPLGPGETVTSISRNPAGTGYWLFTSDGRAAGFGTDIPHLGDMAATRLNAPVLDSVTTPSGMGYYMVAADGGIFAFGDARFYGSMGAARLNRPVQSLVPDPDGAGYWLVASDGGIFAFAASYHGSMGHAPLNRPVTGMVGSRSGGGYLMVAEDGGIFAFGDVAFRGSLGGSPPAVPIVAVAAVP